MMIQMLNADARNIPLADQSVNMVVTSPPYYGLRDYGVSDQIGLEETPEQYVAAMVAVFREVWRVLRDDGTVWLNLGDSYNGSGGAGGDYSKGGLKEGQPRYPGRKLDTLKPKDLIGIPWRVAFALQADGWYLRSDIIWHKPNPMPESVKDRPTKAHEYMFLLSKSARYWYDADAIKEPAVYPDNERKDNPDRKRNPTDEINGIRDRTNSYYPMRNKRSVWSITTRAFKGSHFATFPPDLVEPCIKAGCPEGGIVLDPFAGSGTVLQVARALGRSAVGLDLSMTYIRECAQERLGNNAMERWENGIEAVSNYEDLPLFQ